MHSAGAFSSDIFVLSDSSFRRPDVFSLPLDAAIVSVYNCLSDVPTIRVLWRQCNVHTVPSQLRSLRPTSTSDYMDGLTAFLPFRKSYAGCDTHRGHASLRHSSHPPSPRRRDAGVTLPLISFAFLTAVSNPQTRSGIRRSSFPTRSLHLRQGPYSRIMRIDAVCLSQATNPVNITMSSLSINFASLVNDVQFKVAWAQTADTCWESRKSGRWTSRLHNLISLSFLTDVSEA